MLCRIPRLDSRDAPDGSQFDHLFEDGETFALGELTATALRVPGHTPADMAYLVGDAVFVGDTLFMPDVGTARADFPGGDARTLHRSIRRLLAQMAHHGRGAARPRAGAMPPPDDNGVSYLRIPINVLGRPV